MLQRNNRSLTYLGWNNNLMRVTVCIGTYNRSDLLARTLESVRNADFPQEQYEVIVTDNNSTDATREVAESARHKFAAFTYLFEKRQGLSYARNTSIRSSHGEILCFLDDDTTIDPNYFNAVSDVFSHYDCAGVGARIVPEWNCPKPDCFATSGPYNVADGLLVRFDEGDREGELQHSWFGAGMSISRAALEKHGLFTVHLSRTGRNVGGGEDSDMFFRLREAGERLCYAPKAIVFHPVDPERLSMAFVRKWYFERGKTIGMIDTQHYPSFSQIPYWTIRAALNHAVQSLGTGGAWKRAFHQAHLWETCGQMYGYHQRDRQDMTAPQLKSEDTDT